MWFGLERGNSWESFRFIVQGEIPAHHPGKKPTIQETTHLRRKERRPSETRQERERYWERKQSRAEPREREAHEGKRRERKKPTIPEEPTIQRERERRSRSRKPGKREREPGQREREAERGETANHPGRERADHPRKGANHPEKKREREKGPEPSIQKKKEDGESGKRKTEHAIPFSRLASREMKKKIDPRGQETKPEKKKLTDWFSFFRFHRCISCNRTEFHPFSVMGGGHRFFCFSFFGTRKKRK
jgi:hypothetical protein